MSYQNRMVSNSNQITEQEYATQKPQGSNIGSLDLNPNPYNSHNTAGKFNTRRLSQDPEAECKTTAARPTAFTRVKSKSELNNKQQNAAPQQKLNSPISAFDEGLTAKKASIQKQQSGNSARARDALLNSHPGGTQQKPKHSMKQILHQSHRKLTELLEKAKETKELTVEEDFVIINTTGQEEEEEIKKNSTSKSNAVSNSEGVTQDPNVMTSPRHIKRLTTSQGTAAAAIGARIIPQPSRPVKNTSSGALADFGLATNSSSIKTMASTYHKRDDLLTKSAALYKSGGLKLPGPHPKFNQSNRKTNIMTSRHTPKRAPNPSTIQPAQSFTELRRNDKTLLDRSSRVETKQSTEGGKDLYSKKINESASGRLQTNQTYQRRYQLPMSAKLEGKPIAASQKKPQQTNSYSSQVEQVAKMAASRLQKTASHLNSQKSMKARQLLISGTESDLKIRSFNSQLPQSHLSSSRVSQQKVVAASPKQSNHTSLIFSQDTASKKSTEDQNLQMGQYMFVKTPSKGQANNASGQKRQQQTASSYSKGSFVTTTQGASTVQKRVNPNIIRQLINISPSKSARGVHTALEQAASTTNYKKQQSQANNVFTYAKLITNDSRQQYQIHNEDTAEFGKEAHHPNDSSRGVSLLQQQHQEQAVNRISIQSENAATMSEGCSQKQLPLEPFIRISSNKPLTSSRPQPIQCDDAESTPIALNQRKHSQSFAMIVSEADLQARPARSAANPPFKEQDMGGDLPPPKAQQELQSKQAESNLENAMNFHRRTSQQAVMVLTNEMAVASLPELQQMTYVNPTVSESEVYSENQMADTNEANNDDDDHRSGEQRYETDGEEQDNTGPCETLTERQIATPTPVMSGARTPQHQLPLSTQLLAMQHNIQMTDTDRVPNEQDNSNFQVDDSNSGLENEIRSLSHYSMQQRRQMNTMMASVSQRSQVADDESQPSGSMTSKRPQIPPCDDIGDCTLRQSLPLKGQLLETASRAKTSDVVIATQEYTKMP